MKKNSITYDDVFTSFNLSVSTTLSQKGKSSYRKIKEFNEKREELLKELKTILDNHEYITKDYVHFKLKEHGKVRDIYKLDYYPHRIVQNCLITQTQQCFMDRFIEETYAAIPTKGMHRAKEKVRGYLLKHPEDTKYCLKIDIKKYFPHVNHTILKSVVEDIFSDKPLLEMWFEIIDSHDEGLPIGSYTSQYLANIYLWKFDVFCKQNYKYYCRYMDDIVILGASRDALLHILRDIQWILNRDYACDIKDNWQIFSVVERGIDYVGYRIYPNCVLLRKSILLKLIRTTRRITKFVTHNGFMTDRMRSQMGSYFGWIKGCTPRVANLLFDRYFKQTYLRAGITNISL